MTPTPSFPMETKEDSYKQILKCMNEQQIRIWKSFSNNPKSADHEIAELLDLPLATINARRKELQDLGYIKLEGQEYFRDTHRHRNVYSASLFPGKRTLPKVLSPTQLHKIEILINHANDYQKKMIRAWLD